jgi:hypothetical protein
MRYIHGLIRSGCSTVDVKYVIDFIPSVARIFAELCMLLKRLPSSVDTTHLIIIDYCCISMKLLLYDSGNLV